MFCKKYLMICHVIKRVRILKDCIQLMISMFIWVMKDNDEMVDERANEHMNKFWIIKYWWSNNHPTTLYLRNPFGL